MEKELRYDSQTNKIFTYTEYLNDWWSHDTTDEGTILSVWNKLPRVGWLQNHEYDSTADTLEHIKKVNNYILDFVSIMISRAQNHDTSKLSSPEKELFDKYTPLLKELEYGSPGYMESLENLKPALEHHYANNSHHPQFYPEGINGMTLMDLVEMFFDWKAATERTNNGNLEQSININSKRFKLGDEITNIFKNTNNKLWKE